MNFFKEDFLEETFCDIKDLTDIIEEEIENAKTKEEANELAEEDFMLEILESWIATYDLMVKIATTFVYIWMRMMS